MAEELQSLLKKINADGVKKAQAEHDRIVAAARAEAERIVAAARAEAEEMHKRATADADGLRERAENAVRQAARDLVLKLKAELEERLHAAVAGAAEAALTPEFMAGLIRELAAKFAAEPDAQLTVLAAVKDSAALDAALRDALADSLKKTPKVLADPNLKGGLEVSFKDGAFYFDFSVEAITELIGAYTGPRIGAIFAGDAKK